nr:hypothetical protein [Parafrankia elaeagni]
MILGAAGLRFERDGAIGWCVIDRPAGEILQTASEARLHVKRMLHEAYGTIDYQTMFWSLQNSPEPREGMRAFMEKRAPGWVPDQFAGDGTRR